MVNNNPIMLNNDNIELISNIYWTGKKNNLTFEVDRINGKEEIIKKESVYEYLIEGILEEVE